MLTIERLNEREQELVKQAQTTAENIQALQQNIQLFQQKLVEANTNYLVINSQIKEVQNLKLIAAQPETTEKNG